VNAPRQITLARLAELGITPDTRLGQHFLVDDNLVRVALRLADLRPDDVVLEIGPGLGVLTAALADVVSHVHAIELDRRLEPALTTTIAGRTNVNVRFEDAVHLDPASLVPAPTAFVSNLPYNVATPLIADSLDGLPTVERWAVMIQRELGDRLFAHPGTPAYGAPSVLVQLACDRTGTHRVSRHVFAPPPNVDSVLVGFRRSERWTALAPRWTRLKQLVHAGFGTRRKTFANAVDVAGLYPRTQIEAVLEEIGADPRVRAEALPPLSFVELDARL
jgi:16S rRNA (adenine1518-N6/adenine1519-N6)-dimethyltransferase